MATKSVLIVSAVLLVLVHCVYASTLLDTSSQDESRIEMDSGKVGLLEQRLRDDVMREIRDIEQLEAAFRRNLGLIHEKKRQLEIKRNQPMRCLVNSDLCL